MSQAIPAKRLRVSASVDIGERGAVPVAGANGEWWVIPFEKPDLLRFDRDLREIGRIPLNTGTSGRSRVAFNRRYDRIAIHERGALRLLDPGGRSLWSVEHSRWPANSVADLKFAGPDEMEIVTVFPEPGINRLVRRDVNTGRLIGEASLPMEDGAHELCLGADPNLILLSSQDLSDTDRYSLNQVFLVRLGKTAEIREIPELEERFVADVSPNGDRFVTLPTDPDGDELRVHELPSLRVSQHLEVEAFRTVPLPAPFSGLLTNEDQEEDGFDYRAVFVDNDRIAIRSWFQRVFIYDLRFSKITEEWSVEGFPVRGFDSDSEETTALSEVTCVETGIFSMTVAGDRALFNMQDGRLVLCAITP